MNKIKWAVDKKLRCKNCKHFKLYVDRYESRFHIRVGCSNCGAIFYYSDRNLATQISQFQKNK